jgi:hypothetical protein
MDAAEQGSAEAFVSAGEFADAIRVDRQTVYRTFADGDLPGLRARTAIRIPRSFLNACVELSSRGQLDLAVFGREWQQDHETPGPQQVTTIPVRPASSRHLAAVPGGGAA